MTLPCPDWFTKAQARAAAMPPLAADHRWRAFNDPDYTCPCCGLKTPGLQDIAYDHPNAWPHGAHADQDEVIWQVGRDRLTSDLCRLKDAYFIRATLPMPLQGSDELFAYGPWARIAPEAFAAYADPQAPFDGCQAVLANALPGTPPMRPVACAVMPSQPGTRPLLFAHDGPLRSGQEEGISFDAILALYAAAGQDYRGHLGEKT